MGWFDDLLKKPRPGKTKSAGNVFAGASLKFETPTVDQTRNDYDLFEALYRGGVLNNKGDNYRLASAFVKPIINSLSGFVMGQSFKPVVTSNELDEVTLKEINDRLERWVKKTRAEIYRATKYHYRDGDAYVYIDELGKTKLLNPRWVEPVFEPSTGELLGYDVSEVFEESVPGMTDSKTVKFVKRYRFTRTDIYKVVDDVEELWHSEVYTEDGTVIIHQDGESTLEADDEGMVGLPSQLVERPLPVVALHNDPEPGAVYGNSEVQNILNQLEKYHETICKATTNVNYLADPLQYMKGVNKDEFMDADGNISVSLDETFFLPENGEIGYAAKPDVMSQSEGLLKIYFYLILEGSETPEFVFGAAVQSSKASVSEQMPIVAMRATTKRSELTGALSEILAVVIDRAARRGEVGFNNIGEREIDIDVQYPDLLDEDGNLTKATIDMLLANGVISNKTALRLSAVGGKIEDIEAEAAAAKADAKDAQASAGIVDVTRFSGEADEDA